MVSLTALAAATLAPPAGGAEQPRGERLDGADRFATAAAIARSTFDSAATVLLTTGESYPDALAASYAAGAGDHPVLLAQRGRLPEATAEALASLGTERVALIGGEATLEPHLADELERRGYEIDRVAGASRYETAAAVARAWGADGGAVGTVDGDRAAVLTSGEGFADALAAGPVVAGGELPLLLAPPQPDRQRPVRATLDALDVERVVVVGGEAAVGADVADHYRERGYAVERWSGATRADTAAVVAGHARRRLGLQAEVALLARGDAFPDALAAGVHGGADGAPMLLTADAETLAGPSEAWLRERCPEVAEVRAIGGAGAVSDATLAAAVEAAGACRTDDGGAGERDESRRLSGTLGGDARLEGGCVWLEVDGTRYEVLWPDGWEAHADPVRLHNPDGEVVATDGDELAVEGRRDEKRATVCQTGPVFDADRVDPG